MASAPGPSRDGKRARGRREADASDRRNSDRHRDERSRCARPAGGAAMRRVLVTCVAAVVLLGTDGYSYQLLYGGVRWPGSRATLYHDPATISGDFLSEMKAALDSWSTVAGSAFVYTHGGASTSANIKSTNNWITDVYFDSADAGVLAYAAVRHNSGFITESDVVFNNGYNWDATGNGGSGGTYDFRTVALHEFGHALGLGHELGVPSVMVTPYQVGSQYRNLFPDDLAGVRFLYPDLTPPPPADTFPDLVLESVTFDPQNVAPGEEVTIHFTILNDGDDPSGSFSVDLFVGTGAVVQPTDQFVGFSSQGNLAPGERRSSSRRATVPELPEPVPYRFGAVADPVNRTGDVDASNNQAVSDGVIFGGGNAMPLFPGARVRGRLDALARDAYILDLLAGMRLKLKARIESGSVQIDVVKVGERSPRAQTRGYRSASQRYTVPEDGRYLVRVGSQLGTPANFEFRVTAPTYRDTRSLQVSDPTPIALPGYQGSRIDVKVKSFHTLRASATFTDLPVATDLNRKGDRVKLGPVNVGATGPLELVLDPGEGPGGTARYTTRIRFPNKPIDVSR